MVALLGRQELGVVDPFAMEVGAHDGGTGNHRTGPWPAAGLIDARNRRVTQPEGLALEDPEVPVSFPRFLTLRCRLRLRCRRGRL